MITSNKLFYSYLPLATFFKAQINKNHLNYAKNEPMVDIYFAFNEEFKSAIK